MKNTIRNIMDRKDLPRIFGYVLSNLYQSGPVSVTDMEILSYLREYCPEDFSKHQNAILNYMAVFYKPTERESLKEVVFGQYKKYIEDTYNESYTPVQANIIQGIDNSSCFSFSAPTSTGKSYVFMNLIAESKYDVVVVVPSRALINEYYLRLCEMITDRSVNVLTFIDKINTRFAEKNVFIVTPERCRELFKLRDQFQIDIFLFDEAQLSDEDSKRGIYFDSIVRRGLKAFPTSKFIFAHPFVKNPESQVIKNHFDLETSSWIQYTQKNVGQMFMCVDKDWNFSHFGIDVSIMGRGKQALGFDPMERTIKKGGTVLFYVSKASIYNGTILEKFKKYVDLCPVLKDPKITSYIEQLKQYTGGDTVSSKSHYSLMLDLLMRGIVIHHGSLPLQTRSVVEQFTKEGLCRICFATSTLEQGINMPFDIVFLDRMEGSKPLAVKNLIGRAGRSTMEFKFDYGYVIINNNNTSPFRKIMREDQKLATVSGLETSDPHDEDYENFKEAILNNTYSDQYNLSEKDLEKLVSEDVEKIIPRILSSLFRDGELVSLKELNSDLSYKLELYDDFQRLYEIYLGRQLVPGEANVLSTAIKIILWKVHGKTFKNICWYRYAYASKTHERELLAKQGLTDEHVYANFFTEHNDIPNKNISVYSLFDQQTLARDVSYDLIMYDTYDYIDKLIGFKLSDIFYAAFFKYFEKTADARANKLAKYVRYGTDSDRHIWMLRYGLAFEDIEVLDEHIQSIDATQIVFNDSVRTLPEEEKNAIKRFLDGNNE